MTMSTSTVAAGSIQVLPRIFLLIAAGVGMSNLDLFIVNVAMADIALDYAGASLDSLSWILNAYAVVFAALLLPAGIYADRVGPKRAYLLGIGVFTLASLACALAPGVWWLVGARSVQAIGAALLTPASLGLIMVLFSGEARGRAVRNWAAIGGLAAALGPVLGGVLAHWQWQLGFLINVPVGLLVLALGSKIIPTTHAPGAKQAATVVGSGLFAATVALAAMAIVKAPSWGVNSQQWLTVAGAAAALLLFLWVRSRRANATGPAQGFLSVAGVKTLLWANASFAVAFAAMLLSISLWLQQVWGLGALMAGLAIMPGPAMVPLFSSLSGKLAARLGALKLAAAGSVLFALGLAWWVMALRAEHLDYVTGVLPGLLLTGFGVCFTLPTLIGACVSLAAPSGFSTSAATVTVARQVGTVLGVALLVASLNQDASNVSTGYRSGWWLAIGASVLTLALCLWASARKRT